MTLENKPIPERALRERQEDLTWVQANLNIFFLAASAAHEDVGRGAIVVDTTQLPLDPFGYFSQEQVEETDDEDIKRLVNDYNPARELVLVLLKPENRTSTYRIQAISPEERDQGAGRI